MYFAPGLIEIYIYDELELWDLISTLVHEYFHHLQSVRENAIEDYDKKFEELGQMSPFEVEARKASQKYTQSCLDWILGEMKLK